MPGAESRLAARWTPVPAGGFFLELHGGYDWYGRPSFRADDGTRVALGLSGFEAGVGIGYQ